MNTSPPQQLVKAAMQLHQAGEFEKAKALYLQVLSSQPTHPDALHLYGLACHQQGDHETAVKYIRKAVEQVPDQPVLRNNLGDALHRTGELEEAIVQLNIALDLRPGYAGAHQNLGSVYADSGEHEAALRHARKAVKFNENHPEAWFNLGLALLDHVLLEEAVDAFRRAVLLRPDYPVAVTGLLYTLNLVPGADPIEVAGEHHRVATAAFGRAPLSPPASKAESPLRIGYVSGDFCAHAVNYFFEPVLEQHDRSVFEIYCYSDVRRPDRVTGRLKQSAQHWRDMTGSTDESFLAQVKEDRIDILVDLAGYTKHNRMAVFAHRAAPIQLSWLGFPNTTGLEAMDFRIVDTYTIAESEASADTETRIRLPQGFACFRPPAHAPPVQLSAAQKNGYVTLGCLHKLEKLNPAVLELWARLLQQNPTSRLLLARDQLDSWQQQRLLLHFEQYDIGPDRLNMIELSDPGQSFFELFADIDIQLDTFPWSGHTLACCALWMGVPVVSLYGSSHAGRMVASVLKLLDLDELVAQGSDAYCEIVHALCEDQGRLDLYRRELRGRFKQSPLCDEKGFTKTLEAGYLRISGS